MRSWFSHISSNDAHTGRYTAKKCNSLSKSIIHQYLLPPHHLSDNIEDCIDKGKLTSC